MRVAIRGDVASEAISSLFQEAEQQLGPICGLVNNAGSRGIFALETWKPKPGQVLNANIQDNPLCARGGEANVDSAWWSRRSYRQYFIPRRRTGGAGEWVHYAATKGAVDTFTIGLAREVASGDRVNAVAPGLIATEIHAANGALIDSSG